MDQILAHEDIVARLRRMALQVYEANYHQEAVHILGVKERGYQLAAEMRQYLSGIAPLSLSLQPFYKAKEAGGHRIELPAAANVLIVDDVLYSGETLYEALRSVMAFAPRRVQAAILVDRGHRMLPVSADFVGLDLATTLQDYVRVQIDAATQQMYCYLE
jgi:pyrimidine operon attenuation protein/uracil phosphoribosyltransferase